MMRLVVSLSVLVIIFTFNSCEKTNIQFGQQYVDNSYANIVLVDSISPVVSTIYKDSVITAQSGTLLVGKYTDPYFGKITASSYLKLAPPALADMYINAQYDSLVLLAKCNGNWYGDTTMPITIEARQLTDELKMPEGQFTFYNASTFPANVATAGSRTFVLHPLGNDTARIPMNDGLGKELFNMINRKSDTIKDATQFTNYFKGLRLSTTATANAVYGLKDSVIMRLYYHQVGVYREDKFFDFNLTSKELQFNNITADRSGTPLAALNTNNYELTSDQTNNIGYMQDATGIYLKISFPNIRKLLERTDFVKIVKADLVVQPVIGSNSAQYPLPPQLEAVTTDGANEPGASLIRVVGTTSATETGDLFIDALYGTNTNYTYDVTSYLQQQIGIDLINKNGLLLLPPAAARYNSPGRLVIADTKGIKSRLQLKVYYVSINK